MDQVFFSWLAAQPYSIEVAVGALFVVIVAPAVLGGMAALATWGERLIGQGLRMSGLLNPLERGKKTLWRLNKSRVQPRPTGAEETARTSEQHPRAAN
jgi:hypothetical protein